MRIWLMLVAIVLMGAVELLFKATQWPIPRVLRVLLWGLSLTIFAYAIREGFREEIAWVAKVVRRLQPSREEEADEPEATVSDD